MAGRRLPEQPISKPERIWADAYRAIGRSNDVRRNSAEGAVALLDEMDQEFLVSVRRNRPAKSSGSYDKST